MPDIGKRNAHESLGLAARAEKQNAATGRMRAAQPLELIADPLWRRGADERTRAKPRKTLDEETLAGCTDWRIFFMSPLHRCHIRWFVLMSRRVPCETFRHAPCEFTRPQRVFSLQLHATTLFGHSFPVPIL